MDRQQIGTITSFDHWAGSADGLAHLATFPEQNPNAVIETDMLGRVTYLNPEAAERFPDLAARGVDHALLAGVLDTVAEFRRDGREFVQREVEVDDSVFEQKVCYASRHDTEIIRIYSHDVTAHRRAEHALAELARRVVDAQEQERKRIARELHDETGQAMAALKISLRLLRDESDLRPDALRQNLDEAIDLVDKTRERIRLLAHDLRPPALDALGLVNTLEDFCAQYAGRTRLRITFKGGAHPDLSEAQEICLYRLLQEALANVAAHAAAESVDVTLSGVPGGVRLTIADDGRGMDPSDVTRRNHPGLGLEGMRERLEMLGGRLDIESDTSGTSLHGTLPIRDR